jgi:hypothetical protein
MQIGFVSAIVPELGLEEVFQLAAEEGFDCVEIMCWPAGKAERKYAGITHIDVTGFNRTRADEVNALSQKYAVGISGLGYYPNPLDPNPSAAKAAVAHLKSVIKAAELLEVPVVNTFVGRDPGKTVDENWPRFLKTWKPLVQFAEDHGMRIGIENCPMLYTRDEWPGGKNLATTPAIWRRMFNDIDSASFGLNYDPSHLVLQMMDPAAPLKEFAERIFHFHAKDIEINQAALNEHGVFSLPKEWHQPRIPGYGEMDWARYLGALMEIKYDGPVCIEVEDETFGKDLAGRKRAVRVSGQILRPYFA